MYLLAPQAGSLHYGMASLLTSRLFYKFVHSSYRRSHLALMNSIAVYRFSPQAHDTAIRAFQFAHNGSYLISADQSGIIKYFQPNMNNLVMWNGHREPIRGVTFSPDDQRFATASDDQTIKLWDFQTRTEERTFTGTRAFLAVYVCSTS